MKLSQIVGSSLFIPPEWDRNIHHIVTDSRDISAGDLFIARKGLAAHGERFIEQAIQAGAVAVISETDVAFQCANQGVPVFGDLNLGVNIVSWLANRYESAQAAPVVAVTGTNGKSSVTQYVAQLFRLLNKPSAVVGTLGNGLWPELSATRNTTPDICLTYRLLDEMQQHQVAATAMEVSSIGIEQGRVADLTFTVSVLTNISQDHLDYHGTMENYFAEKAKIFSANKTQAAVINIDDAYGKQLLKKDDLPESCVSIGRQVPSGPQADVSYHSVTMGEQGVQAQLNTPWGAAELKLALVGEFNVANVLAAISSLVLMGYDFQQLVELAAHLTPVSGRMELYRADHQPKVVIDYAHTPDALETVVQALSSTLDSVSLVFGCGGDRDRSKRPLMADAAVAASQVWVTDDNTRTEDPEQIFADIQQSKASSRYQFIHDRRSAITQAIENTHQDGLVLIAGKGHENYQEVQGVRHPYSDEDVIQSLGYVKSTPSKQSGGDHAA